MDDFEWYVGREQKHMPQMEYHMQNEGEQPQNNQNAQTPPAQPTGSSGGPAPQQATPLALPRFSLNRDLVGVVALVLVVCAVALTVFFLAQGLEAALARIPDEEDDDDSPPAAARKTRSDSPSTPPSVGAPKTRKPRADKGAKRVPIELPPVSQPEPPATPEPPQAPTDSGTDSNEGDDPSTDGE